MSSELSPSQQPMHLQWEQADSGRRTAHLNIGGYNTAHVAGDIGHPLDDPNSMTFMSLRVAAEAREKGLATRLISGLAHVAITEGMQEIKGGIESEHIIKGIDKLVGEIVNYSDTDPSDVSVKLPLTNAQAAASLERAGQFEADLENRMSGLEVSVDLTQIDPATLEAPIEIPRD